MKKGQFFIGTIVIVASAITIMVSYMNTPSQVKLSAYKALINNLDSTKTVRQALSSINDYFINNWLLGFDYKTDIFLSNYYNSHGLTASYYLDLPDFIHYSSLKLLNDEGMEVPFGFELQDHNSNSGFIHFLVNEGPGSSIYHLYYDKADSPLSSNQQQSLVSYSDSGGEIIIKTGLYEARLSKTAGGLISDFYIAGSNDLVYSIDSRINCAGLRGLGTATSQGYNITTNGFYVKVSFKGSRFASESYVIDELFFPDRIIIRDNMRIVANTNCNRWEFLLSANKNQLDNYLDANNNNESPVSNKAETLVDSGEWAELYDGNSIGLLLANSTNYVYVNSNENAFEARFIDNSLINQGNYNYSITIVPVHNDSLQNPSHRTGFNLTSSTISLEVEKLRITNLIKQFLSEKGVSLSYSIGDSRFVNEGEWWATTFNIKTSSGLNPFESAVLMPGDFDPNSIRVFDENGQVIHQLSTNNYFNQSSFKSQLYSGAVNNTVLILNLDNRDFNLTITKTGSVTVKAYNPDGSLINSYDITQPVQEINFNSLAQSGFYKLVINGSGACTISSTLPKTIVQLPAQLNSNERIYFWVNESVDTLIINLTTYASGSHNFSIFNENDRLVNSTLINNAGSALFTTQVIKCKEGCYYYLTMSDASSYKIESPVIDCISTSKLDHISCNEPSIIITGVARGYDYFKPVKVYFNRSSYGIRQVFNTDLVVSESDLEVNNSFFSFDFDDYNFISEGVDWFINGWNTCGISGCTNSFYNQKIIEYGPVRAVVSADTNQLVSYLFKIYYNTPIIELSVKSNNPYEFGPNWAVNGDDDLYYSYSGSAVLPEGNKSNYVDKINIISNPAYISKSDNNRSLSIIFDSDKLNYHNSLLVNDSTIRVNAFREGNYLLLINNRPIDYLQSFLSNSKRMAFNYSISSESIRVSGSVN